MPIASMSETGGITASKTRTLGHPFPKSTQIGVRLQPKATKPRLLTTQRELTRLTDVVFLALDQDLLLSQIRPPVLQQRRTTPPLDLQRRPDLSLKETGASVNLLRTLARADARRIATTNSAQSLRTSAGDMMVMLAVNSFSAFAERMEKRKGQSFCQDANALAKEDAKNQLCCFCKLHIRYLQVFKD